LHIIKVKEKGKNRREGKGKKKSSKKPEEAWRTSIWKIKMSKIFILQNVVVFLLQKILLFKFIKFGRVHCWQIRRYISMYSSWIARMQLILWVAKWLLFFWLFYTLFINQKNFKTTSQYKYPQLLEQIFFTIAMFYARKKN
jgi:hypothetical protein